MNFLSMKYFLAVVEEKSISAAARKLFISQQSLSEHMRKLEEEIGTPLFQRGRTISLSLAGEAFAVGAKNMIGQYESTLENIEDITATRRRRISVAIPTSMTPVALSDIILSYRRKYPNYEVSILKRQHSDVGHNMNGVDLYMSHLPLSDELENIPLLEDDPYCVVFHRELAESVYGDDWPRAEEQLILTGDLSAIRRLPFLLQRDRYLRLAEDMRLIFQEYQFEPVVAINSESSGLNEVLCQQKIGCLLSPGSHISRRYYGGDTVQDPDLLSYPIQIRSFETRLCISHEKGKRLHKAERCFIEEAQQYYMKS